MIRLPIKNVILYLSLIFIVLQQLGFAVKQSIKSYPKMQKLIRFRLSKIHVSKLHLQVSNPYEPPSLFCYNIAQNAQDGPQQDKRSCHSAFAPEAAFTRKQLCGLIWHSCPRKDGRKVRQINRLLELKCYVKVSRP